uniref:Uncharacterized protein n=1 Tax=Cacopsylla melanoneura TaxID=428564 RepID=A0A8D8RM89_9HEMI
MPSALLRVFREGCARLTNNQYIVYCDCNRTLKMYTHHSLPLPTQVSWETKHMKTKLCSSLLLTPFSSPRSLLPPSLLPPSPFFFILSPLPCTLCSVSLPPSLLIHLPMSY